MLGDGRQQRFRAMPMQREDLPHQVANLLTASLVEDDDGRTGAAQRAAQQPRRAQF